MSTNPAIGRILLVDDSEPDNVFHEAVIRAAGFTGDLLVFEDATQALDDLRALPHGPLSLVLLDINMPGMDGWEFIEAARPLLQRNPAIVLVMLSSSALREDREQAARAEVVNGYLTKPLDTRAVQQMLRGSWPPLEGPQAP
jgi:CheY-like chemotaxis protein